MKKIHTISMLVYIITVMLAVSCSQETVYRNTFTVTFHANGGYGEMEDQTFVQGQQQALTKNVFTAPQSGRAFGGWAVKPTGQKVYSDAEYVKVTKNMNLYAVWTMAEGDGTASESKTWGIDENNNFWKYADTTVKPGDDFYKHSIGAWQADPVSVGLWNKVQGRENRTDDQGSPLNNVGLICKDFLQNCSSVIVNKPIYTRTSQLMPTTTEDIITELADFLSEKYAEIDALSTQDEVLRYFVKSMLAFHPFYELFFDADARKVTLTAGINETYLPLCEIIERNKFAEDFTFEQLFAAGTSADSQEIQEIRQAKSYWCKYLMGISETEDTTNDIYVKFYIGTFLKSIALPVNNEPTNPHAFENAVKTELGIMDDSFINIPADISAKLSLIADPVYSESDDYTLSLLLAKFFLKYAYANAGYDIVTGISIYHSYYNQILIPIKEEIYYSMPYRYANLKIFYENYILNNSANSNKKTYLVNMFKNIRDKFVERLNNNTWMSGSTKTAAIKKTNDMLFFIGYPDTFDSRLSFDTLPNYVDSQTVWIKFYEALYTEAFSRYCSFFRNNNSVESKLINKMIFISDPLQENSYYDCGNNMIYILIPNLIDPMCNTDYPDAYNYATIGYSIGHEFCHAFDTVGSEYDESGSQKDWWTLSDKLHYEEKKSQLTQLYSLLKLDTGTNVNGEQTLRENMADLGGLTTVYDLFVSKKIEEGYAGEELIKQKKMFFQTYAIMWASTRTDSDYETSIILDTHSPDPFRVNGIVCQFDDWYDIYDVQKGDKYYLEPSQRIVLW